MAVIRNEMEKDYEIVEELTRKAFYNIYVPGCVEHYLVHVMRSHADFVPELSFVIEEDGQIVGSVMYTRARLVDENGCEENSDAGADMRCARISAKRVWQKADGTFVSKSVGAWL